MAPAVFLECFEMTPSTRRASCRPVLPILYGLLMILVAGAAHAQAIDSVYTDLDLGNCTTTSGSDHVGSWNCPGFGGVSVLVHQKHDGLFVEFGADAAGGSDAPNVHVPGADRFGAKIEWRVVMRDGEWHPFATILRWYHATGEENRARQSLIVTRVSSEQTCQVAIVMVDLVFEANQVARDQADALGFTFDCKHEDPYMIPS